MNKYEEKSGNSKFIYYTMLLLICIPFIFYWRDIHELFSSPLSISISAVLITICLFVNSHVVRNVGDIVFFIINSVALIINAVLNESLGVVFAHYNIYVLLLILNNVQLEKKHVQRIRLITAVLIGFFIVSLEFTFAYGSVFIKDAKGNDINPNTLGILVLACYFHIFAFTHNSSVKKSSKNIMLIISTAVAIYYIWISDSRSSLFAIVMFIILYLLKKWDMKNYNKVFKVVLIGILIFPFVYLAITEGMKNITFLGKSFTTRVAVWKSTIELIKRYPILGSGTRFSMMLDSAGASTTSAHNVFLGAWKNVGLIPMISLVLYFTRGKNIVHISEENFVPKKMFLSCMVVCALETLLNDSNTYIFYMLLLLTIKEDAAKEE